MSTNKAEPKIEEEGPWQPKIGDAVRALTPLVDALQIVGQVVSAALQALPEKPPLFHDLVERVNAFPDAVREISVELAKLGWYYDLQLPAADLWSMKDSAHEGKSAEIDALLIAHFEQSAARIEVQLLESYPARAEPLRQAFMAASRQLYFAAIPVLLAQADGLAVDVVGGKLFKSVNKRPQIAGQLDSMDLEEFTLKFLAALRQNGGVNAGEEYRHEFPSAPNRHEIMHGKDLSYGTRSNYLKALSLVTFIGLSVPEILRDDTAKAD